MAELIGSTHGSSPDQRDWSPRQGICELKSPGPETIADTQESKHPHVWKKELPNQVKLWPAGDESLRTERRGKAYRRNSIMRRVKACPSPGLPEQLPPLRPTHALLRIQEPVCV